MGNTADSQGTPPRSAPAQLHFPRWENALEEPSHTPTILIVDEMDLNRRLLKAILKTLPYRILEARRPSDAFALLQSETVDAVIVDLVMPEMSGTEFCAHLKNNRATQLIPILMVTSVQGTETEISGIDSGADEFLVKPLNPSLVRARLRAMLRNKALIDSLDEAETILFALAQSVEQRDKYTGAHCERLAAYSVCLGRALGLSRHDLLALYRGGYLHDIGKVGIPDAILFKRGFLNETEWETMRKHTVRGEEICRPMRTLAPVLPIIRSHHERWDGSGYPDRLQGEQIPLLARVLQVADIYDALTTSRPYKPAFSHDHAIEIMLEESRRGWRDPELVPLFGEITSGEFVAGHALDQWLASSDMHRSLQNMGREVNR